MGIIETGVMFFANSALQNATDDTARLIRTGQLSGALTVSNLRAQICSEVKGLISTANCTTNLQVDLHTYNGFSTVAYSSITKPDGSIDPSKLTVQSVGSCKVVLMRSFYPWTIMTPMMTSLLENMPNGQYLMASAAAFRTEPYVSGSSC
jgi:Flp pilus assembly protein TadG